MIENRRNLRMWQFIRLHTPPQIDTPAHGTCKLAQAEDERWSGQRARSEKFFLRMYGKLFLLTACVASACHQGWVRLAFHAPTPGSVRARNKVECCSHLIHRRQKYELSL